MLRSTALVVIGLLYGGRRAVAVRRQLSNSESQLRLLPTRQQMCCCMQGPCKDKGDASRVNVTAESGNAYCCKPRFGNVFGGKATCDGPKKYHQPLLHIHNAYFDYDKSTCQEIASAPECSPSLPPLFAAPLSAATSLTMIPREATAESLKNVLSAGGKVAVDVTLVLFYENDEDPIPVVHNRTGILRSAVAASTNDKFSMSLTIDGAELMGVRTIGLRGGGDCTGIREALSVELYGKMCVDTYKLAPAKVFLQSEFVGLYWMAEWFDKGFADRRFGTPKPGATLYDMHWGFGFQDLGPKTAAYEQGCWREESCKNVSVPGVSDKLCCLGGPIYDAIPIVDRAVYGHDPAQAIAELVSSINGGSDDDLKQHIDMSNVISTMVVDASVAQLDGFWRNYNNYFLYWNEAVPNFRLIPFDADQSFNGPDRALAWDELGEHSPKRGMTSNALADRALQGPYRKRFLKYMSFFLTNVFNSSPDSFVMKRLSFYRKNLIPILATERTCKPLDLVHKFKQVEDHIKLRSCFLLSELKKEGYVHSDLLKNC